MERVRLTKEQNDAIQSEINRSNEEELLITHIECVSLYSDNWINECECLRSISVNDMAKVLYTPNSYEVIPEYKVGDWIVLKLTGEIHRIRELSNVSNRDLVLDNDLMVTTSQIYHATPGQIEVEENIRFWKSINRGVEEYHHYDLAWDLIHNVPVELDDANAYEDSDRYRVVTFPTKDNSREIDSEDLRLICKAQDRRDI